MTRRAPPEDFDVDSGGLFAARAPTVGFLFPSKSEAKQEPAKEARDEAIERVRDGASAIEWQTMLTAIEKAARRLDELTTDDVDATAREPRALGAAMQEARRRGWITPTSHIRESTSATCHARPKRLWLSKLRGV